MADRYLIENREAAVGVQMFHLRQRWGAAVWRAQTQVLLGATGEAMGMELQGVGGWGDRRAHKTAGACGITHPPRKAAGGKAPQQDRRRLTFFGGVGGS
jgi:hypothetical protein